MCFSVHRITDSVVQSHVLPVCNVTRVDLFDLFDLCYFGERPQLTTLTPRNRSVCLVLEIQVQLQTLNP